MPWRDSPYLSPLCLRACGSWVLGERGIILSTCGVNLNNFASTFMGFGANTPQVFAIDSTERPIYCAAAGQGKFTPTNPFRVDFSAVKLEAARRHAFGGGETATDWIGESSPNVL